MSDGSSIYSYQVSLAAGGTRQPVEPTAGDVPGSDNTPILSGAVKALKGNTGALYLGDSTVTTGTGFELQPGEAISMDILGLGKVYFIGANTADKLCVIGTGA